MKDLSTHSMLVVPNKQMEDFIVNMYNEGYEDGIKAAGNRVKPSDIASVLVDIKGVGTKKFF